MNNRILKVGITQLKTSDDPWLNLVLMKDFIEQASEDQLDLVCFPENSLYRGPRRGRVCNRSESAITFENNQVKVEGELSEAFSELLISSKVGISFGSLVEKDGESGTFYNSHVFFDSDKRIISVYRKVHLFDFSSETVVYKESDEFAFGKEVCVVDYRHWKIGLSICFDLRFPELYREMVIRKGAELILAPAAFTLTTGEAHWHLLNRCRAVENQCYLAASAQWGEHYNSKGQELYCYGHSLGVDPWGNLLVEAPLKEDILLRFEIDKLRLSEIRSKLPCLTSVRLL